MARGPSRREFLKRGAAAGAGILLLRNAASARGYAVNGQLRVGVIGVGGQGGANLNGVAGEAIVALCDVDADQLGAAAARFPQAKTFRDFRQLIDAGGLDAIVVSTPDHTHAPAAAAGLRAGLHVYCEKPLTHSLRETRTLRDLTRQKGVATQMGTQIHAGDNYRRVVELVRSGILGEMKEIHVWVGGGYCGGERPATTDPVPARLDWDLWLGPAPERPYKDGVYAPFAWRGWWDFGNGTLGDMACHHMDLPFWALDLSHPESVEVEGPPLHAESCPTWLIARYQMRRRGGGTLPLTWYHGGKRPRHFAEGLLPEWGNGTLFVGSRGLLLADYDNYVLRPVQEFVGFVAPSKSIPASIGHHAEWIQAAKQGGTAKGATTTCNFEYAGNLTEAVLLGCLAYRAGKKLAWDPVKFTTGDAAADALLQREYRKGWAL